MYNTVNGKNITFLGWAFKKDTNDTRESSAIYVADHLIAEEATISVYDPKVTKEQIYSDLEYLGNRSSEEIRRLVKIIDNPLKACENAHAIAILTEWDEFIGYDWKAIYEKMYKPAFVFDGRNILDSNKMKDLNFNYFNIG